MLPLSVAIPEQHIKLLLPANMLKQWKLASERIGDLSFLGGAQIDKYGNLNSTMIGDDYYNPKTKASGSEGANELDLSPGKKYHNEHSRTSIC